MELIILQISRSGDLYYSAQAAGAAGESPPRECFSHVKIEISGKFEKRD
jgi:hypothetical protein